VDSSFGRAFVFGTKGYGFDSRFMQQSYLIKLSSAFLYCGVEQLEARWAHNPKATGSSPVPATKDPD